MEDLELLIQNGGTILSPAVKDGIKWSTERQGSPGKLTFSVMADAALSVTEGNAVRLKWKGNNIFYGFIFSTKSNNEGVLDITAYDQLRYMKNKDTYVYQNKTATQVLQMIAADFMLQTGVLEDTGYVIPSRVEDGKTLFDIIQTALDETLTNKGTLYVMYDDFGKIALKSIGSMQLNLLIDEETAQSYDLSSSIDENTYNQIKLYRDNKQTGQRDIFMTKDSSHINEWGVLQYYEKLEDGENGQAKADALLKLYNAKSRSLTIKNALGDSRVRAGSMVVVMMNLGTLHVQNPMLVETATHNFSNGEHWMDLKLRGGDISG